MRWKVCLLGAFAVGKTSLVKRFVHSMFSDKYQTTVGVRIDKKELALDGQAATLVLWDLHGEDDLQKLRSSYLRGASGYLLVADGTRSATLDAAIDLQRRAAETLGDAPFALLVNKTDLEAAWELADDRLDQLRAQGWDVLLTSAKTGQAVDGAFHTLARRLLERS